MPGKLERFTTAPRTFFTERRPPGIAFTERMVGWFSDDGSRKRERQVYEDAFQQGKLEGRSLELVVTVIAENLDVMLSHPKHRADFGGTGTLGEGGPQDLLVTDGIIHLFVEDPRKIDSKRMTYKATLTATDGRRWKLTGYKTIRDGVLAADRATPWNDLTRLYFTLRRVDTRQQHRGILTVSAQDFFRQLLSIRALGTTTVLERCDTVMRFFVFFGGVLRDTYGGPLARSRYAPPNWWRRKRRLLRGKERGVLRRQEYRFRTATGVGLLLTRYRNPGDANSKKGPVILAPGMGVRADSFAIRTVEPNLVEFLCENEYDVWLFDYRASPELDVSRTPFSIDDIARVDWPAAVAEVRDQTKAPKVDVIAHCVGSMSFMMSALSGKLKGQIGSAICSQVGAHPVGSKLNVLKAVSGLGYWLQLLFGVKALRVTVQAADTYRRPLLDWVLKFYPTDDPCDNPVCNRIRFVFGESYLHANLDRGTHDAIIEMFGNPGRDRHQAPIVETFGDPAWSRVAAASRRALRRLGFAHPARGRAAYASLRALRHLALILREGKLLTEDGEDDYLTDKGLGSLDFRLCLMSGRKNHIFPPAGIDETRAWLENAEARGKVPELEELGCLDFEDYAHMDCFIGVDAHKTVFPALCRWLAEEALGASRRGTSPG